MSSVKYRIGFEARDYAYLYNTQIPENALLLPNGVPLLTPFREYMLVPTIEIPENALLTPSGVPLLTPDGINIII